MSKQIYNFYPGPAVIFREVLEQAQAELLDFEGTGMSVMELSHRSKTFEAVINEAISNIKQLMGLGDDYDVLFIQGGASLQFSMIPLNFLQPNTVANYIDTGSFANKAAKEGAKLGDTHICFSGKEESYRRIPTMDEISISENAAYVHVTSNNTIYGTQWQTLPTFHNVPLVCDMSSDIMGRPVEAKNFDLIYAGAQKNLGPSGVTVVILKKSFLERAQAVPASMLSYDTFAKNNSLYNTPPCFSIYLVNLTCRHLLANGGVESQYDRNKQKAANLYDAIDKSDGFYRGHAEKGSRSLMNITLRLGDEELEKRFVSEAEAEGFIGVKGHRSVGGLRLSIYNAMPMAGTEALAQFMDEFCRKNG